VQHLLFTTNEARFVKRKPAFIILLPMFILFCPARRSAWTGGEKCKISESNKCGLDPSLSKKSLFSILAVSASYKIKYLQVII
jgi:hypothetical protein